MTKNTPPLILYTKCMRCIINNFQAMLVGNTLDRFNIASIAITMHRHNSCRFRSDSLFYFFWINIERLRINIYKYWSEPIPNQSMSCGNKGIRSGNHLTDHLQRLQCSNQRQRTISE
ncbi:hypothetical protein D3C84_729520 [compost metagenome]